MTSVMSRCEVATKYSENDSGAAFLSSVSQKMEEILTRLNGKKSLMIMVDHSNIKYLEERKSKKLIFRQ